MKRNRAHSQTPTLNASEVIKAILKACRRGIQVVLYLDLGFSASGAEGFNNASDSWLYR
jgi:hypothetical protein